MILDFELLLRNKVIARTQMKLFFLIASLLFAKFNAENWHPHDDFEFLLSATEKNFIEAAKSCDSLGATLARINTEKVELFLGSLINSSK